MKLPKVYQPQQYESDIYSLWEKSRAFEPSGHHDPYCIVMPPPNANGNLHLGHALTIAVEDSLIRYHRMNGRATLYLPGADHAGFETQVVYEKVLEKEGKSRFEFSREELFNQIWKFVESNKGNMLNQTKQLGASVDWSRFTFTLDQKIIDTTYDTFKRLWDDGLIYRGKRLVNYCTKHGTSFADIEVVYEDRPAPLYYMKYGPFTLATTRPETKFADTAVAVHPDDKRYEKYIGQEINVQGIEKKFKLKVIADEYVDPEFGTGVVKMTPAHDFNDWEVGERHDLDVVQVIDYDGTLNSNAGRFEGMTVEEGREAVVKALKEKDLLEKIDENYQTRVGVCYKCGTVIEPMLMEQWFVKVEPLAKKAIEAIETDKINFYPRSKRKVALDYLKNLKDWNISRQISWGIPIPAYQNTKDPTDWIFHGNTTDEIVEEGEKEYRRDPDVFDTWFSSGQWPFATLEYPKGKDFKQFYPLSVMETGYDILFQWVSRMIMLGLYVTGDIPFKDVYLHGLVLDENGQKMSKSKGNVINPIDVLEKYGSDALRMGLLSGRSAGMNQAFTEDKVVGARNFANKLWNIARYVESVIGEDYTPGKPKAASRADHWILQRLHECSNDFAENMGKYRFSEAYELLYHLVWNDFADWYVEVSKIEQNRDLLAHTLEIILKLTHPFAPFVTETIWQTLHWTDGTLATEKWPTINADSPKEATSFEHAKLIVSEIRNLRTHLKLRDNTLYYRSSQFIEENADLIIALTGIRGCMKVEAGRGLHLTKSNVDAWLDVEENVLRDYLMQLITQRSALEKQVHALKKRLENKEYLKKAPKKIVSQSNEQLEQQAALKERLDEEVDAIESSLKSYQVT